MKLILAQTVEPLSCVFWPKFLASSDKKSGNSRLGFRINCIPIFGSSVESYSIE
jgi:hypothetical protein